MGLLKNYTTCRRCDILKFSSNPREDAKCEETGDTIVDIDSKCIIGEKRITDEEPVKVITKEKECNCEGRGLIKSEKLTPFREEGMPYDQV